MPIAAAEIRRGLEAEEFFPEFQPLIELRTGQLAGFEMLARWNPRAGATLQPGDFIPAVEKAGLMHELTGALLRQAFQCWAIAEKPLMLAFNLSATQLLDARLPVQLEALAQAAGFPLDRLTVEITESALVDDLERARQVAQALKSLNCRLALDDFGTGYSSLTHLHALPFDELKVDRSFVSAMAEKRESREIVASVIGLGLGLGMLTVAEGVETAEQAEMLFWMGCDLGQGWLYGKAVGCEELPATMARSWPSPGSGAEDPITSVQALPAHRLAQLQAIYDGAPVGLGLLDKNLRYLTLNRQLAEMNGLPAAAHLGRHVSEVIPDVFPLVEPFLRQVLTGKPLTGVEIRKPKGQTMMLSYRPVREGGGEVVGVCVAVMDVTQRRKTEEALKETEDHYRHIMKLGPHVPWVLDREGQVVEASPRWEDYTGQPLEEAKGDGWQKMLHPEDVARTREAIRESLDAGLPMDVDYRVKKPGGEWIWMRSRGAPRFSASGEVLGVYGVVEQTDDHRQATAELRECEAELRGAVNAVPIGMVLADGHDGTIYMVNPAARAILQDGAFAGQKLSEYGKMGILTHDGQPLAPGEHPLARAIQRGETIESQPYQLQEPDGKRSHLSISSRAIYSDEGRLIGGMMMVRELGHGCAAAAAHE